MGRWAQRRRTGGGPTQTIVMVDAQITATTDARVRFSAAIDASQLVPGQFDSSPSVEVGDTISQISDREIEITFVSIIGGDTVLGYNGTNYPGLAPQTINY